MTNPYSELLAKIDDSTGTQIHLHCFLVEKQLRLQQRICHLLIAVLASIWLLFFLQPLTGRAALVPFIVSPIEGENVPSKLPDDLPPYRHFQALK